MNLIEQQTAAKELPMQYLQQAVNGQNPNLTPWIATAELQRRTTMNQHMQNSQRPQGPQPTVKDQVEQKAGLMATQAAQQAQAAQAQQSSPPPGPVPEGVPQPEPQPEEPIMAARGGLMNAPVNFQFAHGGILGYAGDEPQGSQVRETFIDSMGIERDAKTGEPVKSTLQRMGEWRDRQQAQAARPKRQVTNAADERMLRPPMPEPERPYPDRVNAGRQPAPAGIAPGQGIMGALPKPPAPPVGGPQRAPAPTPQAPPAPQAAQEQPQGQAAMGPAGLAALNYSTEPVKARTPQDAINELRTLRTESGVDQPIGKAEGAQQARQDEVQRRQQEQARILARAAGVAASVGVPGSQSLAYNQTLANALGNEAEYGQAKYKNIADLGAAERTMRKEHQAGLETSTAADRLAAAAAAKDKANVGANIYGTQEQSKASKYSADSHAKSSMAIAKMQERMNSARQGSAEARQAASELRDRERAIESDIKALTSQRNKLSGSFTPADRKELEYVDEMLRNAREQHALVRGGKGAAPASTMAPPPPGAVRLKKG